MAFPLWTRFVIIWPSFNEIGEMACITSAWSSGGHALKATFHCFASALRKTNSNMENILFVGWDRQRSKENGLAPQMSIAQFFCLQKTQGT